MYVKELGITSKKTVDHLLETFKEVGLIEYTKAKLNPARAKLTHQAGPISLSLTLRPHSYCK